MPSKPNDDKHSRTTDEHREDKPQEDADMRRADIANGEKADE